jgi:hypothetical protein
VRADLDAATRTHDELDKRCVEALAMYEEAVEAEREAWGAATRGHPQKPKEWKTRSDALARLAPRVMAQTTQTEAARRVVERLRDPREIALRVRLAKERMEDDGHRDT